MKQTFPGAVARWQWSVLPRHDSCPSGTADAWGSPALQCTVAAQHLRWLRVAPATNSWLALADMPVGTPRAAFTLRACSGVSPLLPILDSVSEMQSKKVTMQCGDHGDEPSGFRPGELSTLDPPSPMLVGLSYIPAAQLMPRASLWCTLAKALAELSGRLLQLLWN